MAPLQLPCAAVHLCSPACTTVAPPCGCTVGCTCILHERRVPHAAHVRPAQVVKAAGTTTEAGDLMFGMYVRCGGVQWGRNVRVSAHWGCRTTHGWDARSLPRWGWSQPRGRQPGAHAARQGLRVLLHLHLGHYTVTTGCALAVCAAQLEEIADTPVTLEEAQQWCARGGVLSAMQAAVLAGQRRAHGG